MNVIPWNGEQITAPGIYSGIPLDSYHGGEICDGPSISSSGLRTIFSESAAHYWAQSPYNADRDEEPEQSKALIMGRAAHHLLLGQPFFTKEFTVRPEELAGEPWQGNRKACKIWLEAQAQDGLTVLLPEQFKAVSRMAKALDAEPIVQAGILRGKLEHSMFAKHQETGIWLKARPDAIPTDAADFADYKTTSDVHLDAVRRTIHDWSYHMQGGLIGMVWKLITGTDMTSFNLVFQETKSPFSVRIVALTNQDYIDDETGVVKPSLLKRGVDECEAAIKLFAKGMQTGEWLGPAGKQNDVQPVGISTYAERQRDYRMLQIAAELA